MPTLKATPPLKGICALGLQNSGVDFYRLYQPTAELLKQGLITKGRNLPFSGQTKRFRLGLSENPNIKSPAWNDRLIMEMARDCDIIWTTLIWDDDELLKLLDLRHWSQAKWVVDIDDNMYAVTRDNPAERDVLNARHLVERCLSLADGVTTSVPTLKQLYKPLNPHIFVQPNCLDLADWHHRKPKRDTLRIGWRGAYGHQLDVSLATPALKKLRDQYDFELVAFGVEPTLSDLEWQFHDWVGFLKYPKTLADLSYDIAIVPLVDSAYNRCKSHLAWLEYSALKIPVVYSPTENQRDLPGFPVKSNYDWYEALEQLILDAALRQHTAQAQYQYLKDHYLIQDNVADLATWLNKLPRRVDLEPSLASSAHSVYT